MIEVAENDFNETRASVTLDSLMRRRFTNVSDKEFRKVVGETASVVAGWSADCPLCVGRIFIDNHQRILPCENGHTSAEVWEFVNSAFEHEPRTPGADDDDDAPAIAAKPPGWGFVTATDFLALQFPPIRWLYLDLVPAASVTVVMAAPNAGKTFFGLDVLAQVAAKAAAAGLRVFLVEEEGMGQALQTRLSRALLSVGITPGDPRAGLICVRWNSGRNLRNASDLKLLVDECQGAELIMLDSLSALMGGVDENSSQDMAEVANALHLIKQATGSAVMPLHHMTKAAWKEGETPRLEHMRGHGALPGRADAVLALVPLESDEQEVRFELHCVKQRDGSKPSCRKYSIAMTGPIALATIDGDVTAAPENRHGGRKPKRAYADLQAAIIKYVKNSINPPSGNNVATEIGGGRALVFGAISELIEDGVLRKNDRGRLVLNSFRTSTVSPGDRTGTEFPP